MAPNVETELDTPGRDEHQLVQRIAGDLVIELVLDVPSEFQAQKKSR